MNNDSAATVTLTDVLSEEERSVSMSTTGLLTGSSPASDWATVTVYVAPLADTATLQPKVSVPQNSCVTAASRSTANAPVDTSNVVVLDTVTSVEAALLAFAMLSISSPVVTIEDGNRVCPLATL